MEPSVHSKVSQDPGESLLLAIESGFTFHFAAEYYDRGWSVFPLCGKRPAISSWLKFQHTRAELHQLRKWFRGTSRNLGIVTGSLSGLVVVDCDTREDARFWTESFPRTPLTVATGRGGSHFYYRYPIGEDVFNRAGLLSRKIDLRGQGGYVVAPPSRHANGSQYRWQQCDDYCLDELPYFSTNWITPDVVASPLPVSSTNIKCPRSYIRLIQAVSGQGGHNQTFRAACKLRDAGLSPDEALAELIIWNRSNVSPPWSVKELLHKVKSAYQGKKRGGAGRD